jgi:predicted nucleic acid-binding protein
VRLVVDTGVFSAALSRRRRPSFDRQVNSLRGHQLFLAVITVAELRYGAIVAGWGEPRRRQLESAISVTTVVPVSDRLLSTVAETRAMCRRLGHPLHEQVHTSDLWVASVALHIGAPLVTADRVFEGLAGLVLHLGPPG